MCFTNGKGSTKKAALTVPWVSFEGLFFLATIFLLIGTLVRKNSDADFSHYPNEKWFPITDDGGLPEGLLDKNTMDICDAQNELKAESLIDLNTGNFEKEYALFHMRRQSDKGNRLFPS